MQTHPVLSSFLSLSPLHLVRDAQKERVSPAETAVPHRDDCIRIENTPAVLSTHFSIHILCYFIILRRKYAILFYCICPTAVDKNEMTNENLTTQKYDQTCDQTLWIFA